jgi:hypothetical protein
MRFINPPHMRMNPPDGYDVAIDEGDNELGCSQPDCHNPAVEQAHYDIDLCPDHLKDEVQWDQADNQNKSDREEYGQYETDRSTG